MPKNSRPDIQVLEARVIRLKAQLLEYKEIRTYGITKKRLSDVALELEECISIIGDITEQGKTSLDPTAYSSSSVVDTEDVQEFDDSGDLSDVFNIEHAEEVKQPANIYEPKWIIKTYSERMKVCADMATGIIQVNQFASLLNEWFQTRFSVKGEFPLFHYKANRIHEWVDVMMLAGGYALNSGTFPAFKSELDTWLGELKTPKGENWVLPQSILQIKKDLPNHVTEEAVLLEKILKPQLYDETFYPNEMDSVAKIVMINSSFSSKDLTVSAILDHSPTRFVRTSAFDIKKYQEET